ncbi:MAG: prolyl oligopeptidase family serine peptidase, partial [Bacteroidota bacterium]
MKKLGLYALLLLCNVQLLAQNPDKKTMDHDVFDVWNRISRPAISNDGNWVIYELTNEGRDPQLQVYHAPSKTTRSFDRGTKAKLSADNQWLVFKLLQPQDSLKAMRRRKVKKNKLPKDSLGIYHLSTGQLTRIANVQSFKMPEKWSGHLAYHLAGVPPTKTDTTGVQANAQKGKKKKKKTKKANKKNGTSLVIRQLADGKEQRFDFVKNYVLAEENARIAFSTTGKDSTWEAGVYLYHCPEQKHQAIFQGKGKYKQLKLAKDGQQLSFIADLDTSKNRIRPFELFYWKDGNPSAKSIQQKVAKVAEEDYWVSEHFSPYFSENGQRLYFGAAPHPLLKDTTLLPEEVAKVEVWSYKDPRLHTQQKVLLDREKKRSYLAVWDIRKQKAQLLGHRNLANVNPGDEGNSDQILAYDETPYLQNVSWEGFPSAKDVYLINQKTGRQKQIARQLRGAPQLSPKAKYVLWYSSPDTSWFAHAIDQNKTIQLTNNRKVAFYNELNDIPQYPSSYGRLGWTKEDREVLIYDRYDIWRIDPIAPSKAQRLTRGRESKVQYRYIRLDREERMIDPKSQLLLSVFDETTKASGYAYLSLQSGKVTPLLKEEFSFTRRVQKAKEADQLLFTKESFQHFPDLMLANLNFQNIEKVSDANPQQKDYSWGNAELYEWTNTNGEKMQGVLVKPENFDPKKKYPMIVNFYERSSNRLYRHRAPYPHRSTINYAFYTNRGYLIFNPDVKYREGYPGESAFNCVIPGVTSLIGEGFVDAANIGIQGHSWGGYQIAYLITKTNLFKCAESGAPVVNMFSA